MYTSFDVMLGLLLHYKTVTFCERTLSSTEETVRMGRDSKMRSFCSPHTLRARKPKAHLTRKDHDVRR